MTHPTYADHAAAPAAATVYRALHPYDRDWQLQGSDIVLLDTQAHRAILRAHGARGVTGRRIHGQLWLVLPYGTVGNGPSYGCTFIH